MPRYAKLTNNWALRGWSNHPFALVNPYRTDIIDVSDEMRYVLESCDNLCDFLSPAFLPRHRQVLDWLIKAGIAEDSSDCGMLDDFQKYRFTDNTSLIEIHWAITGKCNMNCGHCFMESPHEKYGEPDIATIESIADQFVKANIMRVSLTGGEPLLRKDFRDIVKILTDRRLFISQVVTNGTLLNDDVIKFFHSQNLFPEFQISFDGVGLHDHMRNTKSQEERVIEAIKLSVKHGHPTTVCSIFSRDNIHTIQETYELIKSLGVNLWMISRAHKAGCWTGGDNALSLEEMGEACLKLHEAWLRDERPLMMGLEHFYNTSANSSCIYGYPEGYSSDSIECPTTKWKAFLLPDCTIMPCTGFAGSGIEKEMPNLLETDLSAVLRDSSFSRFISESKGKRLNGIEECRDCEYLSKCGAGCRACSLTETGSMMKPDPFSCSRYKGGWGKRFVEAEKKFERLTGTFENAKTI